MFYELSERIGGGHDQLFSSSCFTAYFLTFFLVHIALREASEVACTYVYSITVTKRGTKGAPQAPVMIYFNG